MQPMKTSKRQIPCRWLSFNWVLYRTGGRIGGVAIALLLSMLLSGCGLFGFGTASTVPTAEPTVERRLVPTFTPTPVVEAEQAAAPTTSEPVAQVAVATATSLPADATVTVAPAPEPTTAPANTAPLLTIAGELINIRTGPATAYDLLGTAPQGQTFDIVGKNPQGDWWQICCLNDQRGWIFGQLATVENTEAVAVAADIPPLPTPAAVAVEPTPAPQEEIVPEPAAPISAPDPGASSAGFFDPNAQYQVTNLRVLGLGENNGGIRSPQSLHYILVTVLDANGNGVDGAVVRNLVGGKEDFVTGNKGPGKTEITMFYEPYKLTIASDPSGPVTSQVSNQMGLTFPHLPDLVGKLGDENYEYGACPTLEIKCQWPIQAIHFSYEITFQKVK